MVHLDHQLLWEASHLTNEENADRLKEMIFAYEQAVDLHNQRCPGHEIYRMNSELTLRRYVLSCTGEAIRRLTAGAIEAANQASIKSRTLAGDSDLLQKDFAQWVQMTSTPKRVA
jgi:hypothetical protein